jgi:hypothetical protein
MHDIARRRLKVFKENTPIKKAALQNELYKKREMLNGDAMEKEKHRQFLFIGGMLECFHQR